MPKIIDYLNLCGNDMGDLDQVVLSHIESGWQPLGGIMVNTWDDSEYYYQTMVKYVEGKE